MWVSEKQSYAGVLDDFRERFNTNGRAKKLVKNWNRCVLLESTDTGSKFGLIIQDQMVTEVREIVEYHEDDDELVHLQADEEVLMEVFSGRYNPATALVDGALAIFSKDRDKVKLEALAMVIWRLG